jgi:hypothetical protein
VFTCCPAIKLLLITGALGLLGYAGWEAGSCCHQSPGEASLQQVVDLTSPPPQTCTGGCTSKTAAAPVTKGDEECCEPVATATAVSAPIAGWATVKGQVVFAGAEIPKPAEEKVTSDQQHCLANGPILNKVWDIDAASKGVANMVVFIMPERNEELPVHEAYASMPGPFVLDQPHCVFTPRVFAVRKGQTVMAKNPDPVSHNVVIKGIKNDLNVNIPPGTDKTLTLVSESNAMAVSCGSHPWMRGYAWCFDHPYFTVTDKDGKFEIKNVPAGARKLVIWHETGYLTGYGKRDAKPVTLNDGQVMDVGQIQATPK